MKQYIQHRIVVFLTCMAAFLLGTVSGNTMAGEVYSWTDENGVVHFGDRSPEGQNVRTIVIPETASNLNDSQAESNPGTPGNEEIPPKSLADQKRDQMAKDRKENREKSEENKRKCAQHRQRLAHMEPSRRVIYTDENGQSVRMDDVERISMVNEDKDFIADNCK
jgi:hypothetical protein